ncbi:MAG: AI-2E family transporter [Fibrobacteraceae bacterium]|nr:AI-2E family transporter [Fibrobacteraceae bacterium]
MIKTRTNVRQVLHYITIFIACSIVFLLAYYLRGVLAPFCAALLIAYIVDPLVTKIEHKIKHLLEGKKLRKIPPRLPRLFATIIVLIIMITAITAACFIFIPQIVSEFSRFGELTKKFMAESVWVQKILTTLPPDMVKDFKTFAFGKEFFESMQTSDFWETAQSILSKILPGAMGVLSGTATVILTLVSIVFIIMYTTFLMLDMPKISTRIRALFPLGETEKPDLLKKVDIMMKTYFRAQTLVAFIVGCLYALAFYVIDFPVGIVLGLFIGVLNLIPYLQVASMPIAFLLGIIYSFDTGIPFWEVIIIIASIYLAIQIIEDMLIIPKIVGTEMNLPPVLILLSISVWGKLLGILGLVCAIPFTCIVIAVCQEYVEEHKIFPRKIGIGTDKDK